MRDSVIAIAAVVGTRPRAIPLAMITMRKSIHEFPSVSYLGMGLRLAALRADGAPLLVNKLRSLSHVLCYDKTRQVFENTREI